MEHYIILCKKTRTTLLLGENQYGNSLAKLNACVVSTFYQARSKQNEGASHLSTKSSPKPPAGGGNAGPKSTSKGGNKPQASNSRNNKKTKSGQRLNQYDLIVTIDLVTYIGFPLVAF